MFDIGFWELAVIAIVLLLVMGPERLPEVAKQLAFLIRKARQGLYRIRSEMSDEINGTPLDDFQKARQEMADFKNDIKRLGKDFVDSAESQEAAINKKIDVGIENQAKDDDSAPESLGSDKVKIKQ